MSSNKSVGSAVALATLSAILIMGVTPSTANAGEETLALCYYSGSHCSDLVGEGYWSNCSNPSDPNFHGVVTGWVAAQLCGTRHTG